LVATNDDDAGDDVDWCYLRRGKAELMLNGMYEAPERPAAPDKSRHAAHADTCLYFGCPDIDGTYRHLREHGIEAKEPVVTHYGMKQVYCSDPDGYLVCFQWEATPKELPVP
jgi:hypothetical protein